jgi:hypothetical protein
VHSAIQSAIDGFICHELGPSKSSGWRQRPMPTNPPRETDKPDAPCTALYTARPQKSNAEAELNSSSGPQGLRLPCEVSVNEGRFSMAKCEQEIISGASENGRPIANIIDALVTARPRGRVLQTFCQMHQRDAGRLVARPAIEKPRLSGAHHTSSDGFKRSPVLSASCAGRADPIRQPQLRKAGERLEAALP